MTPAYLGRSVARILAAGAWRRGPTRARWVACLAAVVTTAAAASQDTGPRLAQTGGGELVLAAPASRIVTLAPHLAELVFLAGAGDLLLATSEYSDHPPAAAALPRIGDAFRFDLERLVRLEPDLVIAWQSGNPGAALTAMEDLGLPVWRTEVLNVDDLAWLLREIGRATGRDASARAAAVESRWSAIQERFTDRRTVRFFYQVAEQPLYTVTGKHLISQGLVACGGSNVFRDLPGLAPQVGIEAVLQADPDVLVSGRLAPSSDPLARWRDWPRMAAVRGEGFIYLPADLINRATPRMLDAVEQACAAFDDWRSRHAVGEAETR
jgi:iron complex transport system substrate-binding protein